MRSWSIFLTLVLTGSFYAFSQVEPAASKGGFPIVVGGGYSNYYTELFPNRMYGTALWADWHPQQIPSFLKDFGVESEFRMLNFGQKPDLNRHVRMYEFGGGPMYTVNRWNSFRPYAKLNMYYVGMNHAYFYRNPHNGDLSEHWVGGAPGGGLDYRVAHNIWVRVDYEYQFWKVNFSPGHSWLNPQGFTVGAAYDFRRSRR